jgi:uncharacterized membrane protein YgaE (UPF0421/DUF939 family)
MAIFNRQESTALRQLVQSPRPTKKQTLLVAAVFAAQVIICSVLLHLGYRSAHAAGVNWAIISAVLVLQPGIGQSIAASAVRIAANLIGAVIGLIVGYAVGTGSWQVVLAMVIVVFICEPLRLDFGLRTACVSVIIVMTANGGNVLTSSIQRFSAVLIGCGIAVVIQLLTDRLHIRTVAPPAIESGQQAGHAGE